MSRKSPYSSDPALVQELLLHVAKAQPDTLHEPDVIFQGFGDSSLDFKWRVWTRDSLRTPQIVKSNLYYNIFQAFSENNIEIPFPQRDIRVRPVVAPIPFLAGSREPSKLATRRQHPHSSPANRLSRSTTSLGSETKKRARERSIPT